MIERLAQALVDAGWPLAPEDLSAIAWLALSMPAPPPAPSPAGGLPGDAPAPARPPPPPAPPPTPAAPPSSPPAGPTDRRTTLYASSQQGQIRAGVLRVPGVLQAPPAPQLRRALQPFTRRVPSATRWLLDEEATAERRADTRVWELRYRRLRERWFDLHVVVDRGAGMDLWQGEVDALVRGLKSQGGFRSLQRCVLGGAGGRAELARRADGPALPLAALHPPGQRPLVLLLTDGSAERWHAGAAQRWLWAAAERAPLAVLQLMPPHAWRHTPLGDPVALGWWPRAGLPASALRLAAGDLDDTLQAGWRAVPLVALAPAAIQRWALAATARGGATVPVALVGATHAPVRRARGEPEADERVARYRHKASAAAFDLAVFLSVPDPLTLPVMRLVQRTMLPSSGTAELAEFFNGGLLEPLPGPQAAWRLRPGVRQALRGALRFSEERHIVEQLRRVGQALEDAAGDAPRFEAWFPSAEGAGSLSEWALPFAEASQAVLRGVQPSPAPAVAWRPCLAVHPGGQRIAVGSADGQIRFWDAVRMQLEADVIQAHGSAVQYLAWTPDGRLLASAAADGEVRLHDAQGALVATLQGGAAEPVGLSGSTDGLLLAQGSALGKVQVWDLAALGAQAAHFEVADDSGVLLDLCLVGRDRLAVLLRGGRLQLRRADSGELLETLPVAGDSARLTRLGETHVVVGSQTAMRCIDTGQPLSVDHSLGLLDGQVAGLAAEGPDGLACLTVKGRVRYWRAPQLKPFDVTVQVEPDTAALAAAPGGRLFALTRGGQVLEVPRPHREERLPTGTFLSQVEVLQAVHDSGRVAEGDTVLDALLIFATRTQQSWMVFTRRSLVMVLDDANTRRDRRLVQGVMPYDQAVPVNARVDPKGDTTVGFAKVRTRWYYSTALFATPALLEEAVDSRAAQVRDSELAVQRTRLSIVTVTAPDGRAVAGGYWVGDGLVATSRAALAGDPEAEWQVHVAGRDGPLPARQVAWDDAADAALLRLAEPLEMLPLPELRNLTAATERWHAMASREDALIGGDILDGGLRLREGVPSFHGPLPDPWRGVPVWSAGAVVGHLAGRDASTGTLWACDARVVLALRERALRSRRVFLSYSHHDAGWIDLLQRVLLQAGSALAPAVTKWGGEGWGETSEAIASCGGAVVLCTPAWAASAFVQRELEILLQRRRVDPAFGILVVAPPDAPTVPALADAPTLHIADLDLSTTEAASLQSLVRAWSADHERLPAAQQLARSGEFELAWKVLEPLAPTSEVVRLRAHALRHLGQPREALATVEAWLADHAGDATVLLERAQAWRELYRRGGLRDTSAARHAADDFERVWTLQATPWTAVSAAALWLPLGDRERSQRLAQAVVERVAPMAESHLTVDPFLPAAMAEALVLLGRLDEARRWLGPPYRLPGIDLQPAAAAIRADLQALGTDPASLDDVLPPARVIAIATLPADAVSRRFEPSHRLASETSAIEGVLRERALAAPGTATTLALVAIEALVALKSAAMRQGGIDVTAVTPIDPAELARRWRHDPEAAPLALWAAGDSRIRRLSLPDHGDTSGGAPSSAVVAAAQEAVRHHARERAAEAHVRPQLLLFWHAPGGRDAALQAAAAWHEDGFEIDVVDLFDGQALA